MKILLIHPGLEHSFFNDIKLPSLGLAYIAGVLRVARHDVRIFDGILSRHQLRDIRDSVLAFQPAVVGIGATSSLMGTSLRIATLVKSIDPRITTVFGGVHPSLLPEEVIREPQVDFVVRGEGEETMRDLVGALENSQPPEGIQGVVWKRNGSIVTSIPAKPVEDLDSLPFPAYDLLPIRKYYSLQISASPFASMITSRGCPYQCVFCSARTIMGGRYRTHSPARTVAEIRYLMERFGVREVLFKDSEFTTDPARVEAICELLLAENVRVKWSCNGRVGKVGPGLLEKMQAAGCRLIEYGIESGDEEILRVLDKRISIDQVRETFAMTRRAGLKTIANFMIGNPGETRESIEKTLRVAKEIRPDYADFSFSTAFPGTKLYEMARQNGWLLDNYDPANIRLDECTMNATRMSTDELRGMFRKVYRKFYLRPGYILGRIFSLSPYEWKMNVIGSLRVMGIRR